MRFLLHPRAVASQRTDVDSAFPNFPGVQRSEWAGDEHTSTT